MTRAIAGRTLPAPDPATRVPCPYDAPGTVVCPVHAPTDTRMLLWEGPSVIDGSPIVVLATGVPTLKQRARGAKSANSKTGDMVQTFILRADINPVAAIAMGADVSICGVCPHKGKAAGGTGACYVNVGQGPRAAWVAHQHTGSTPYEPARLNGLKIRFGAYGDPAAAPASMWAELHGLAAGVTGYTHQWDAGRLSAAELSPNAADPRFREWMMASADSADEGRRARTLGYRSFIVRAPGDSTPKGAIVCPASAEAGRRTVCADCMQCGGTGNGRRNDVSIVVHGTTARAFRPLPLTVVS